MNENEFDLTARAWLDDGPIRMSDRAVQSALEEIHTTRQRRAMWPAWRATPVSIFGRMAGTAVLAVAVGLLAVNVLPRLTDGSGVGGSSPSSTPTQELDLPNLTKTFVSPRNGFSVKHPERVVLTPAKQLWGLSQQVDDGFDVVETGLAVVFKGASTGSGLGDERSSSTDERVDEYLSDDYVLPGGCGVPRSQQAEITIDGQSGRISECPNRIEATVVAAGRLYFFTLVHDRSDAKAVFDAFAATIDLTPETAVDFPVMTTSFVSPTYGYSFKYHDRGGLAPATELWDPANQPLDNDNQVHNRFDAVETGLAAYFAAASTEIPEGISIDEWVDEYVSPGGCEVPRSQQAEITIDGQSGRISECANRIEATVVAGGRLYLFTLLHDRSDARAFFDAWIASVDLTPETASGR
ncbi:MAG: hypothetical protein H0U52_18250 [Chloroflexi bacterium]|nr:hypothetical protein [Chloroflexota bacterium]